MPRTEGPRIQALGGRVPAPFAGRATLGAGQPCRGPAAAKCVALRRESSISQPPGNARSVPGGEEPKLVDVDRLRAQVVGVRHVVTERAQSVPGYPGVGIFEGLAGLGRGLREQFRCVLRSVPTRDVGLEGCLPAPYTRVASTSAWPSISSTRNRSRCSFSFKAVPPPPRPAARSPSGVHPR